MREVIAVPYRLAMRDDKKPSRGVRIGDGFSHCASACIPKDGPMVHLLRLMKG